MDKNAFPVLMYRTEDGITQLEVQMDGDMVEYGADGEAFSAGALGDY